MARSFWSGTVSFGLVGIPVKLHPAERRHGLQFGLLDRDNLAPVGYRHFNKETGKEVPWERIVKGYEYAKGEYVVLSDADFEHANPKSSQTIQIVSFVKREEIDPIYFSTPYFVAPDKRAGRSYQLLHDALVHSGRVGIARVVLRTREHLAALLPREGLLALDLIRWAHELVKPEDLEMARPSGRDAKPTAQELRMAGRLIDDMAEKWKPEAYQDEYRDDLMRLIEKKVKSGETHVIEERRPRRREAAGTSVVDLMPLLKQSLAKRGKVASADGDDARRRGPHRARGTAPAARRGTRSAPRTRKRSA
jgi:DNA end-binding protein Ku